MSERYTEINADGLVGPSYYFGGLSVGNLASTSHAGEPSDPRETALAGIDKMAKVRDLGVPQLVFPPHPRPIEGQFSSAHVWVANMATVTASCDSQDHRIHVTPANLSTFSHRAIESSYSKEILELLFHHVPNSVIHDPCPSHMPDEGAANYCRLSGSDGRGAIHIFVCSQFDRDSDRSIPRRQSRAAIEKIIDTHKLDKNRVLVLEQSDEAVESGAFHNDVVCMSHQNILIYHENAFKNQKESEYMISHIMKTSDINISKKIICQDLLPIEDAVKTYLFNSQILTTPDGCMLLAPMECRDHPRAQAALREILNDTPIDHVEYVDVSGSMKNGGGPACLRLRFWLTQTELAQLNPHFWLTKEREKRLRRLISDCYPDCIDARDIELPGFEQSITAAIQKVAEIFKHK